MRNDILDSIRYALTPMKLTFMEELELRFDPKASVRLFIFPNRAQLHHRYTEVRDTIGMNTSGIYFDRVLYRIIYPNGVIDKYIIDGNIERIKGLRIYDYIYITDGVRKTRSDLIEQG